MDDDPTTDSPAAARRRDDRADSTGRGVAVDRSTATTPRRHHSEDVRPARPRTEAAH